MTGTLVAKEDKMRPKNITKVPIIITSLYPYTDTKTPGTAPVNKKKHNLIKVTIIIGMMLK